jgi:predicted Zn-dependent protease
VAAGCYAQALQLSGRAAEAEATLLEAVLNYPACQRLRRQLLAFYVRRGQRKEALAQIEALPPEVPYREALRSAVRGACLAVGGNWIPARAYLESAYRSGCRDAILLEWLSRALMAEGEATAALPILAEWRHLDPHHPESPRIVAAAARAAENVLAPIRGPVFPLDMLSATVKTS